MVACHSKVKSPVFKRNHLTSMLFGKNMRRSIPLNFFSVINICYVIVKSQFRHQNPPSSG